MVTLIDPIKSHSCAPLVFKDTLSSWWSKRSGFNELFPFLHPKYSPCVCSEEFVQYVLFLTLKREQNRIKTIFFPLCVYIYIYIPYIIHTDWTTWLNVSELGWVHKKSNNNVSSPIMDHNSKIKITLIYDIITLIM